MEWYVDSGILLSVKGFIVVRLQTVREVVNVRITNPNEQYGFNEHTVLLEQNRYFDIIARRPFSSKNKNPLKT